MRYEMVIGLEVHVELSTKTKIFCGCTTAFGAEPNTNCCPICTGMPGVLPVLNKKVVEYAIAVGLATGCEITRYGKFDRKNYFYPDLPKAYQISQLYLPICQEGKLEIEADGIRKDVGIREIHMEEDAGKLIHQFGATLADYNRCGVPLIEIVSHPDLRSADEVIAYLTALRSILRYLGVSDCKMEEGSIRADVNLSLRPAGQEEFGVRTEMKNMNSFKAIARAIEGESKRQAALLDNGEKVVQETRRWDDEKGQSYAMRSKEDAQDYRYFPEPDLPPVVIDEDWLVAIGKGLPELPAARKERYISQYGLTPYDAGILVGTKELADYFEAVDAIVHQPKEVANWLLGDFMRLAKSGDEDTLAMSLGVGHMAALIDLVAKNTINRNTAKKVFAAIWDGNEDPLAYVKKHNLAMVNDDDLVKDTIAQVLANNVKSVEEYRSGKEKVFGFLVGQTMKALKGKADPATVNRLLKERLNENK